MARDVILNGTGIDSFGPVTHLLGDSLKQAMQPLALSQTDTGSDALVDNPKPIHEPEVIKKKSARKKAAAKKSKISAKVKADTKSKTTKAKTKLPARVAKKTAHKSPAKRAPSASTKSNAQVAVTKEQHAHDLVQPQSVNSAPPWKAASFHDAQKDIAPLPQSAAIQIYRKSGWIGNVRYWLRKNVFPILKRQPKAVAATRPAPKKLSPRDMVGELNRLSDENRMLRRKLEQYERVN